MLLPAPGLGIPVVLVGFALVAEHFLRVARLLDLSEPPLRSMLAAGLHWWKHAAVMHRWAVGILALLLVLAAGAGLFALLGQCRTGPSASLRLATKKQCHFEPGSIG